tara:strand:- start:47 stop:943 length:897 start_codon:yes stop_codon:yes gene_type:complete
MHTLKYTPQEQEEIAEDCFAIYGRHIDNYQPITAGTLQTQSLTYQDHPVTVLHYDSLPQAYTDQLQAQLTDAALRGYRSQQPLLLFLHQFDTDANIGGGMTPMSDLYPGVRTAFMGVNIRTGDAGSRNLPAEHRSLVHEFWHIIDYAGDYSRVWADIDPDSVLIPGEAPDGAVWEHMKEAKGRGRLSVGHIVRALKDIEIGQFRVYSDQPHELWVHHRMCETQGLTPRTVEGYHHSHNLMYNLMCYLSQASQSGIPRSMCRQAAQRFLLEIQQDRKGFLEEMRAEGYGWMVPRYGMRG